MKSIESIQPFQLYFKQFDVFFALSSSDRQYPTLALCESLSNLPFVFIFNIEKASNIFDAIRFKI